MSVIMSVKKSLEQLLKALFSKVANTRAGYNLHCGRKTVLFASYKADCLRKPLCQVDLNQ